MDKAAAVLAKLPLLVLVRQKLLGKASSKAESAFGSSGSSEKLNPRPGEGGSGGQCYPSGSSNSNGGGKRIVGRGGYGICGIVYGSCTNILLCLYLLMAINYSFMFYMTNTKTGLKAFGCLFNATFNVVCVLVYVLGIKPTVRRIRMADTQTTAAVEAADRDSSSRIIVTGGGAAYLWWRLLQLFTVLTVFSVLLAVSAIIVLLATDGSSNCSSISVILAYCSSESNNSNNNQTKH